MSASSIHKIEGRGRESMNFSILRLSPAGRKKQEKRIEVVCFVVFHQPHSKFDPSIRLGIYQSRRHGARSDPALFSLFLFYREKVGWTIFYLSGARRREDVGVCPVVRSAGYGRRRKGARRIERERKREKRRRTGVVLTERTTTRERE